MKFDELNQLKRFFASMEISDDEKDKRCDFAYLLYGEIYYFFAIVNVEIELAKHKDIEIDSIAESHRRTFENRLEDAFKDVPHEPDYIPRLVDDIVDTTNRHLGEEYYVSKDRALLIAQNESNSAYNYVDYDNAVKSGKQYKVWLTENDEKVRLEHEEVDGMRIPINELFIVGGEQMRYPHDYNASPQNIINCRCVCVYE